MLSQDEWTPLLRQVLQALGGVLMGLGVFTEAEVSVISGAVISVATAVWMLTARRTAAVVATAPAAKVRDVLTEAGLLPPEK